MTSEKVNDIRVSPPTIPFHRPYELDEEDIEEIWEDFNLCLDTGMLTNNVNCREFEEAVRNKYNTKYAISTTSNTQGLSFCLQYLMSEDNNLDTIWMPSFEWKSVKTIIDSLGLAPLYRDISKTTWNIKDGIYYPYLNNHTFGNVSPIKATLHDSAHAFGSRLYDIGEASVFSFAPTKLITSLEGGMIITNNEELAEFVINLRDQCGRLPEFNAIYGLKMMFYLNEVLRWKRLVYNWYKAKLPGIFQKEDYSHNFNTIGFLNTHKLTIPSEIQTKQYYLPLKKGLINTDYVYENIICLPSFYSCPYKEITELILEANDL